LPSGSKSTNRHESTRLPGNSVWPIGHFSSARHGLLESFTVVLRRQQDEKFGAYIIGGDEAAPVIKALKQKMQASKPFEVVVKNDVSKVLITINCLAREKPSIVCIARLAASAYKDQRPEAMFRRND